jgi:hypothetical protein
MKCKIKIFGGIVGALLWMLVSGAAPAADAGEQRSFSLAGAWQFAVDREGKGIEERWFGRELPDRVRLPGAMQSQGFGDPVSAETAWTGGMADRWAKGPEYEQYRKPGNIKLPCFLTPDRHYVGAAWYRKEIDIPVSWEGRRVVFTLERAHWQTRAWLDDRDLGSRDSLCVPHVYDLGIGVAPGRHVLTLRVDNRMIVDVGAMAHSVTDHTQGNWNGVVGQIEMSSGPAVWLRDVQAYPDVGRRSVRLKVRIGNATGKAGEGRIEAGGQRAAIHWNAGGGEAEIEVPLGEGAKPWDEFQPAMQATEVVLAGDGVGDRRTVAFGLREIRADGRALSINGRSTFLRGTLECCIFPLTGFPPTDVESWRRIIRVCKEHGLNHIRFHSWCPPEAAFVAADELGFYYQVECGVWTQPGNGGAIDQWIYDESERIVRAYGNHPSFVLLTHGNEPHGPKREEYLAKWVNQWKQKDPRFLVTSGSAYPQLPENQYHVFHRCRGPHGWLGKDYRRDVEELEVPVIVHEMGQWCVYPNFDEIAKYTGPLKARNFEIFRESLEAHGMLDRWRDFLKASGRLQALCYKEEIEGALRTPGIAGFQLLDLHDFPGQGTALVGVLDAFGIARVTSRRGSSIASVARRSRSRG